MKQSTLAFPTIQRLTTMAALVLGALFLGGCATEGAGPVQAPSNAPAAFELTIAHINDHHSQLDAFAATELVLDGRPHCIAQAASPGYETYRTGWHCVILQGTG